LECVGVEAEQTQDRLCDPCRLDAIINHARTNEAGGVDDDRHVPVLDVRSAVLGDLALSAGEHDAVLDDAPHVGMPRILR
jgi:hypothetical protein